MGARKQKKEGQTFQYPLQGIPPYYQKSSNEVLLYVLMVLSTY
jgi:hypothetical protein